MQFQFHILLFLLRLTSFQKYQATTGQKEKYTENGDQYIQTNIQNYLEVLDNPDYFESNLRHMLIDIDLI